MEHSQFASRLPARSAVAASPATRWIVTFAIAYAIMMILPSFLSARFPVYPSMRVEDVFSLLNPLILITLYWLLLRQAGQDIHPAVMLTFLLLSVLYADGHGMHLAGNSIDNLMGKRPGDAVWDLTYFYDELMGHYYWFLPIMALSILLVAVEWRNDSIASAGSLVPLGIAGFIYGTTFFMNIVEGQAGPLGVPFAALFTVVGFLWGREQFRAKPILTFFFIAYLVALVLFAAWGIYWGGLPEFSAVGILK